MARKLIILLSLFIMLIIFSSYGFAQSSVFELDLIINESNSGLGDYEGITPVFESYYKIDPTQGQVVRFIRNNTGVTFQPMALNYRNDLNQLEQIQMINSVTGYADGTDFIYPNAYGIDFDLKYTISNMMLKEELVLDSQLPSPAQYIIDGGNPVLELNFVFGTDAQHIVIDGVDWDKKTDKGTTNEVYIRDDDGNELYHFAVPFAVDSVGAKVNSSYYFKKTGNSLYVSIHIPYSWLNDTSRVYPVYIDPSLVGTSTQTLSIRTSYMEHMVKTSNDYLFVSYRDSDKDWRVSYSTNNGSSWTSVEVDAGNYHYPNIGARNNDSLYSISSAPIPDDIYWSTSNDYGVSWSNPAVIVSHASIIYTSPSMIVGGNGYIHLTYREVTTNDNLRYMFHNNISWSTPLAVETLTFRSCDMEVDTTGMIHIIEVYGSTSDIKWFNCSANCNLIGNWDSQIINSHSDAFRKPDVAIDSLDGIATTYSDITTNKSRVRFNYFNRTSKSWRYTQLPASVNNQDIIQSGITVDSLDVFHVMWNEYDWLSAWQNIYYTNSSDYGHTWETPVEILSGTATDDWQSVNMRGSNYPISNKVTDRLDYIVHDIYSNQIWYYSKPLLEFELDVTSPNVTLNYPPDNFNNTLKNMNFSVNAIDDQALSNCSLWHNISGTWSLNETRAYSGTSDTDYFIAWNVSNNCYVWNAECCDQTGNCAFHSTNYTFCQNYTPYPPVIVLNEILNKSYINVSWAILNATVTDMNNDSMIVYFYANDDLNKLNKTCGFVYMAEDVLSNTDLIYNLTALPVKPNATDLVGLYHFDEVSEFGENSTHIYDWSGKGHNGTAYTTSAVNISAGKFAGAFDFDGDDYVNITHIPEITNVSELTLMAWVKPSSLVSTALIVGKYYDATENIMLQQGISTWEGTDDIRFRIYGSGGSIISYTTSNIVSLDGKWHHYVGVFNGSGTTLDETIQIYYDGQKQPITHFGGLPSFTTSEVAKISVGHAPYLGDYFEGVIDEVAIFNRSLSASEVLDYYRLKDGTYYWKVKAEDDENIVESDIWEFYINLTCNFTCSGYGVCNISDLAPCNDTTEQNQCGKPYIGNYSEFTAQACNYCSVDLYQTNSSCQKVGGLYKIIVNYTDYNYSTCCAVTGIASDCSILFNPYNITAYLDCALTCELFTYAEHGILSDKIYFICESSINDGYCYSYIKDSDGGIVQVNPQKNIKSGSFKLIAEEYEDRSNFTLSNGMVHGYFTKDDLLFDGSSYTYIVRCHDNETWQYIESSNIPLYEKINAPQTRIAWWSENQFGIIAGATIFIIIVGLVIILWR